MKLNQVCFTVQERDHFFPKLKAKLDKTNLTFSRKPSTLSISQPIDEPYPGDNLLFCQDYVFIKVKFVKLYSAYFTLVLCPDFHYVHCMDFHAPDAKFTSRLRHRWNPRIFHDWIFTDRIRICFRNFMA